MPSASSPAFLYQTSCVSLQSRVTRRRPLPKMELVSITLARVAAMVQLQEWDPFGKALSLEAIAMIGNRYTFSKTPTKFEDLNPQKGIELAEGRLGDICIDRINIFQNGIVIDTRSSTENSERVLNDILALANEVFGATITPARRSFASQIIFRSSMRLVALSPVLPKIAGVLSERASADLKHSFSFEPTAIVLNVDTSQVKNAPVMFTIERRADVPFAENTYFSSASLRTVEHIEIVKAFEASLLG